MSATRDPVETVNALLRRAGQPSHCTWIPALPDLGDALVQINPEVLLVVDADPDVAAQAARVRDQIAPEVPIVALADNWDDERVALAMRRGVRDVGSLSSPARLEAVLLRELRACRLERALNNTLQSARDYRRQLQTVLERSNDAIAHVQEGIVIEANDAWLEMFGLAAGESLAGQPLMDSFEPSSHSTLKGALAACAQGKWNDHALEVTGRRADGAEFPLELLLSQSESEGEPSVRLMVPGRRRDEGNLAHDLAEAVKLDPTTGFLHRRALLDAIRERLGSAAPGGVRCLAQIRLDKFASVEKDLGIESSDQVLTEFAGLLRTQLQPRDIVGRFGGPGVMVLIERATPSDAEAWGERVVQATRKHVFHVGAKTISATCSIGVGLVPHQNPDLDAAAEDAMTGCRKARQRGGSQVYLIDRADADTRVQAYDQIWVKHIRQALMENRFRLVQQPIASLSGQDAPMYDMLVRMLDHQGKEVLPSEFMPAAQRNDLLKNIDRWVIGASFAFAAQRKPGCVFVRLSKDSIGDSSLPDWMDGQLRASKVTPSTICFQVAEEVAGTQIANVQLLSRALRQRGLKFAFERFGVGRDPVGLLDTVPVDFVKIDRSLVQTAGGDEEAQQKLKQVVEAAHRRRAITVAEQVEDANTMALLWQLGVQYAQGYFIQEPEEVVLKAER